MTRCVKWLRDTAVFTLCVIVAGALALVTWLISKLPENEVPE